MDLFFGYYLKYFFFFKFDVYIFFYNLFNKWNKYVLKYYFVIIWYLGNCFGIIIKVWKEMNSFIVLGKKN